MKVKIILCRLCLNLSINLPSLVGWASTSASTSAAWLGLVEVESKFKNFKVRLQERMLPQAEGPLIILIGKGEVSSLLCTLYLCINGLVSAAPAH